MLYSPGTGWHTIDKISQCCCQGLTSRGQGQGLGVRGRGRGQGLEVRGQGPGLAVRGRGQGLKFQMLKHLLNNDINFLE